MPKSKSTKQSASTSVGTWVGRLPGQGELLRVHLPSEAATATMDVPAHASFGEPLYPVLPFDAAAWRDVVGEYTDGEIRVTVTMWPQEQGFPIYADVDHDAIVRLSPISEHKLLSEQGEEIEFDAEERLHMSLDGVGTSMHRAAVPQDEQVEFALSDETTLSGTLLKPSGDGPFPAVVLAHDSDTAERWFYRVFAHAFVRMGLAALVFDRQGHGDSSGEPDSTLHNHAAEVEAAMEYVRSREDVETVGLWGLGEGMWTVPLIAARRPDVAFVAGIGAPGVPKKSEDTEYDPANSYQMISCPVLLQYGQLDTDQPTSESVDRIGAALKEAGNSEATISVYDDAGTWLSVPTPGREDVAAADRLNAFRFASGSLRELTTWMRARAEQVTNSS